MEGLAGKGAEWFLTQGVLGIAALLLGIAYWWTKTECRAESKERLTDWKGLGEILTAHALAKKEEIADSANRIRALEAATHAQALAAQEQARLVLETKEL
jgi:hypothetical protein